MNNDLLLEQIKRAGHVAHIAHECNTCGWCNGGKTGTIDSNRPYTGWYNGTIQM
jgi:hypothetical protein